MPHAALQLKNPPLIETVLGVQFAQINDFTSAHPGWFWKNYLGSEWTRAVDAPALDDQFETFGEKKWVPGVMLKLTSAAAPPRLQISNRAEDRLIQVQATRFIYNWQKKTGDYPGYASVRAEFSRHLATFKKFLEENSLGTLIPNQWEMTYVNRVAPGELWQSPSDWHRVLPGLFAAGIINDREKLENFGGEWHFEITPARGRAHVSVQLAKIRDEGPSLLFQTTVRGPLGKEPELEAGLDEGHDAVIRLFLKLTSEEAMRSWGKV